MGQRKVMQGLVSRIAVGVFGLLTVAMILLAVFDDHGALRMRQQRGERDKLQHEIEELQLKNLQLRQGIDRLRDNDEIERLAREHLKMIKPGEIQIQIPPAEMKSAPEPTPEQ